LQRTFSREISWRWCSSRGCPGSAHALTAGFSGAFIVLTHGTLASSSRGVAATLCTSKRGYSHLSRLCRARRMSAQNRSLRGGSSIVVYRASALSPSLARRGARRTTLPPTLLNSSGARMFIQSPSQNGSNKRKVSSLLEKMIFCVVRRWGWCLYRLVARGA
jgi:hypothetical protein